MVGLIALALLAASALEGVVIVAHPGVDELSGLAVSRADPALLWGHNDTGHGPELYRIGLDGADLGRVTVPNALSGDWEDIASFSDARGPALLIGDVGDNLRMRSYVTLYAVRDAGRDRPVQLLWRMDVNFPDGPRDCESLAVDPLSREILLLSKRDDPPRLYRVPLPAQAPKGRQIAEFVGTLAPMPRLTGAERLTARYVHMPTAMDISADGLTAVIVTLRDAYVYRRRAGESWATLFARGTAPLPLPAAFESTEAAALSPDGRVLYLGSEGEPGRLLRIDLPP
jgi:hypothetical protein